MKISRLDIYNFRKLKNCKIDIANQKTIFVGANNSGKTSAMNCLMLFLGKSTDDSSSNLSFTTYDFTLPNWKIINEIGKKWENRKTNETMDEDLEISLLSEWGSLLPQLDVWIEISEKELYHVYKILPSLDWSGGKLGVRLRYEPKNIISLFNDFREHRVHINKLKQKNLNLWPSSLLDFLKKGNKLNEYFKIKAYILPSELFENDKKDIEDITNLPLDFDPFKGLVRIDFINAQRGFGDSNDKDTGYESLSKQLRKYYEKHLSADEFIEKSDLEAIKATENAKKEFDKKISDRFADALKELKNLNYPAFGNPNINISSKLNPIDGFNHESAVLFDIFDKEIDNLLKLSEKHNGLGYQNLISMTFKLMAFRDAWMKVGKAGISSKERHFEPLHLVLIEEPEAHLHAQVQQVFIKEAYSRLRDHSELGGKSDFQTQLIVSTHSNHIVEEVEFSSLRYFKRNIVPKSIPTSTVVNLSKVFGNEDDTIRFAKRYLKLAHADLFFADAVILVEGQAERLLVPQFIKDYYESLNWAYISLLEIGGSHAYTLQPLIDELGIITLVVADIDAVLATDKRVKAKVEKGKNLHTRNTTLKKWLPKEDLIDKLLSINNSLKETNTVKVVYQLPKKVKLTTKRTEVLPNTFEDALIFEEGNIEVIKKYKGKNSIKDISIILNLKKDKEITVGVYEAISKKTFPKAEFALDLLYLDGLKPPQYIKEGLDWLTSTLTKHYIDSDKS